MKDCDFLGKYGGLRRLDFRPISGSDRKFAMGVWKWIEKGRGFRCFLVKNAKGKKGKGAK